MKANKYRLISQIAFFLLFLYLLNRTDYSGTDELKYPAKLFLDIDPLIAISTFLANHILPLLLWLSLITLVLTAVLGRFFCGWACPFGSINHFFSFLFNRRPRPKRGSYEKYQKTKYAILFIFLGSAALGLNLSGFLDPISLTIRSFTVGILPYTNYLAKALLFPILGSDSNLVQKFLIPAYSSTKDILFSQTQASYTQSWFILSLFLGFILLNLIKNRFYCRVICPLGALLGACSKYSILELDQSELCTSCQGCASTAQGGASPEIRGEWKKSECVLCLNCVSGCSKHSIKFKFNLAKGRKKGEIDLRRREIAFSMIGGIVAAPLLRFQSSRSSGSILIRPPGSLNERNFLKTCVKCEECMKVCPTNVLEPTLMKAGIEGMWSPHLDMGKGYCEYSCNLCGQVCPTGAIKKLPVEIKQKTKMGTAFIDKSICLPWASNTPCLVCEEHCPTSPKAIELRGGGRGKGMGSLRPKRPQVNPDNCIGCGICQNKCPVEGLKAIRVTNAGEQRSN